MHLKKRIQHKKMINNAFRLYFCIFKKIFWLFEKNSIYFWKFLVSSIVGGLHVARGPRVWGAWFFNSTAMLIFTILLDGATHTQNWYFKWCLHLFFITLVLYAVFSKLIWMKVIQIWLLKHLNMQLDRYFITPNTFVTKIVPIWWIRSALV